MLRELRNNDNGDISNSGHSVESESKIKVEVSSEDFISAWQNKIVRSQWEDRSNEGLPCNIAKIIQKIVRPTPQTTFAIITRQSPIKEQQKYSATEFNGVKGVDHSVVEIWL